MTMELDIESAMLDRLKQALEPLPVEAYSDKDYRFTHPKGAALLMLADIDLADTVDAYIVAEPASLVYEVLLKSRSLRDASGLYQMLRASRESLMGWTPPNCVKPMKLKKGRFLGHEDGAWSFSLLFVAEIIYVTDADPEIGPLLTEVNFEEVNP